MSLNTPRQRLRQALQRAELRVGRPLTDAECNAVALTCGAPNAQGVHYVEGVNLAVPPPKRQTRTADFPGVPRFFSRKVIQYDTQIVDKAPAATDPGVVIARIDVAAGQSIELTKWGQLLVPRRPSCKQAPLGNPAGFLAGSLVSVLWYLVWQHAKAPTGSTLTIGLDPRGSEPLVTESGTARIGALFQAPKTLNITKAGPGTVLFAWRYAVSTTSPQDHLLEIGGLLEGYIMGGSANISDSARFTGKLAAAGGG